MYMIQVPARILFLRITIHKKENVGMHIEGKRGLKSYRLSVE